ncbi:MAG: hypothetical protein KGD68_13475 [Candidatus Lokiarchaeota archaeon]|nr:hypothetical protein [Candidatus Lokiarchaeota archaeon]
MNKSDNCDNSEFEYYSSIIEFFQNQNANRETIEIWKSKSLIKLMKVLERSSKKEFVKNAILVILSLFDENPPDIYNCRGKNVNSIDNGEKRSYKSILKTEFIDELPN